MWQQFLQVFISCRQSARNYHSLRDPFALSGGHQLCLNESLSNIVRPFISHKYFQALKAQQCILCFCILDRVMVRVRARKNVLCLVSGFLQPILILSVIKDRYNTYRVSRKTLYDFCFGNFLAHKELSILIFDSFQHTFSSAVQNTKKS